MGELTKKILRLSQIFRHVFRRAAIRGIFAVTRWAITKVVSHFVFTGARSLTVMFCWDSTLSDVWPRKKRARYNKKCMKGTIK